MHDHARRAEDNGKTPPLKRMFSWQQMALVLGVVATLQTIGGKFVIDSYIDQRITLHNGDAYAHHTSRADATIFAELKADRDRLDLKMEEHLRTMNEMNQRLSRIEGALQVEDAGPIPRRKPRT